MSRNALPASFGEDLQGILKNSCEGDYLTTGEFPLHSRGISQCENILLESLTLIISLTSKIHSSKFAELLSSPYFYRLGIHNGSKEFFFSFFLKGVGLT